MKFALLIISVLALAWLLRAAGRRTLRPPDSGAPAKPRPVEPMLACSHCGVLMPRDEALPGRGGVFCGTEHRDSFESSHPSP